MSNEKYTNNGVYSEFGVTIGMPRFIEQDDAMKTCREWTNTKCQNASEIIPMLEKYAKLRTMEKKFGMKIPEKDKDGYDNIEKYRINGIKYWKEIIPKPYAIPDMRQMVLFSTFHWSIYNMNETIVKENNDNSKMYNDVLSRIILKDSIDEFNNIYSVKKYRNKIEPDFERIKITALKQANSSSNYTNWYEFW